MNRKAANEIFTVIVFPAAFIVVHVIPYNPPTAGYLSNLHFYLGYMGICLIAYFHVLYTWVVGLLDVKFTTRQYSITMLTGIAIGEGVLCLTSLFICSPMPFNPFVFAISALNVWAACSFVILRQKIKESRAFRRRAIFTLLFCGNIATMLTIATFYFNAFRVFGGLLQSVSVIMFSATLSAQRAVSHWLARQASAGDSASADVINLGDTFFFCFGSVYRVFIFTEISSPVVFIVGMVMDSGKALVEAWKLSHNHAKVKSAARNALQRVKGKKTAPAPEDVEGGNGPAGEGGATGSAQSGSGAGSAEDGGPVGGWMAGGATSADKPKPQQQQQPIEAAPSSDVDDPEVVAQLVDRGVPAAHIPTLLAGMRSLFTRRWLEMTVPLYYLVSLPLVVAGPNREYYILFSSMTPQSLQRAILYSAVTFGVEAVNSVVIYHLLQRMYGLSLWQVGLPAFRKQLVVNATQYSLTLAVVTKYLLLHCNLDYLNFILAPSEYARWTAGAS